MANLPQDPLGIGIPIGIPPPILPVAPAPPPSAPLTPQLPETDPLAALPPAPAPDEPQGYQFDANGDPLPWPPDALFEGMPGVPSSYTGHDVPVVGEEPPKAEEGPPTPEEQAAQRRGLKTGQAIAAAQPAAAPGKAAPPRDPYLDTLDQAAETRARAVSQEAEATKAKNAYLADEGTRIARAQSERQAAADTAYQQVFNEAKAHRAQLDKEAQDLANQKIDRGRLFHNASFGAQLFVGITAALSGATTRAVQTGQNPVLEQINKMVEQDLQSQQADLENKRASLGFRRGLLADELAAGRDMLDVSYKSLNAAYDTAVNQTKAYAMQFDNPVIDARAATTIADIMERKAQLGTQYQQAKEQQLYQRRQDSIHNSQANRGLDIQAYNAETARLGEIDKANKGPSVRDQVLMSKEQREQQKYHDERVIPGARTKKGEELLVLDDKQAGPLRDKMATITSMSQKLDELETIYEKHGWNPLGKWNLLDPEAATDAKRAKVILGTILPEFSKANEQGVIRDKEYPMYLEMFGDPTALLDPRANITKMREMGIRGMNNELRAKSPKQDVAWWEPEKVPSGNDRMTTTDDAASKRKQRAEQLADNPAAGGAPRPSWEVVGQSPDGTKSLLSNGLVIPAGRQVVGQQQHTNNGGRTVDTYELDDGSTFDVEE